MFVHTQPHTPAVLAVHIADGTQHPTPPFPSVFLSPLPSSPRQFYKLQLAHPSKWGKRRARPPWAAGNWCRQRSTQRPLTGVRGVRGLESSGPTAGRAARPKQASRGAKNLKAAAIEQAPRPPQPPPWKPRSFRFRVSPPQVLRHFLAGVPEVQHRYFRLGQAAMVAGPGGKQSLGKLISLPQKMIL